jgi:hypothetical protein
VGHLPVSSATCSMQTSREGEQALSAHAACASRVLLSQPHHTIVSVLRSRFYEHTVDRKWGTAYLKQDFFHKVLCRGVQLERVCFALIGPM